MSSSSGTLNRGRILDGSKWSPPKRRVQVETTKNGRTYTETKIERLCSTRNIRAMNPAGSVVFLCLGNANQLAEEGVTQYAAQIRQRKLARGWLPWGQCPAALVSTGEITWASIKDESLHGSAPCADAAACAKEPCPHLVAEHAFRTKAHNAKMQLLEDRYLSSEKIEKQAEASLRNDLVESSREQAAAMRALVERLGDKLEGDAPAKKRG